MISSGQGGSNKRPGIAFRSVVGLYIITEPNGQISHATNAMRDRGPAAQDYHRTMLCTVLALLCEVF